MWVLKKIGLHCTENAFFAFSVQCKPKSVKKGVFPCIYRENTLNSLKRVLFVGKMKNLWKICENLEKMKILWKFGKKWKICENLEKNENFVKILWKFEKKWKFCEKFEKKWKKK